jgi:hypothetical protein
MHRVEFSSVRIWVGFNFTSTHIHTEFNFAAYVLTQNSSLSLSSRRVQLHFRALRYGLWTHKYNTVQRIIY